MKISYNWLNRYLSIPLDIMKTSDALTSIGLEVEKVIDLFVAFDHLVIGKVIDCVPHPNADRLRITQVDVGGENAKQIICGAPNVQKNQFVVVVLEGKTLIDKDGKEFKIKKTKIRGELSEGMICAEDEIGLGNKHEGIIELEGQHQVGVLAKDYFEIEKDYILEIGLTPNRTDAFSHIGVCRDLYAYFTHRNFDVSLSMPDIKKYQANQTQLKMNLVVDNMSDCMLYSGVCIDNVSVGPSPNWLKNMLQGIGVKSINNVVDITNFVLHETGNPLHAFDYDKILDAKIIVRNAIQGEKLMTLDSSSLELDSEDIVIADSKKALCLAGVIGGIESSVSTETTSIFLESAFFTPKNVRRTAKRHSINTDSSYRFERGVDFSNCYFALKRAALLIQDICGGTIGHESSVMSNDLNCKKVIFSFDYCNNILGHIIPKEIILSILSNLDFEILNHNDTMCELLVPSSRFDVYRQIDVVEEVLRIYGYDNLPMKNSMTLPALIDNDMSKHHIVNIISNLLTANGFFEIKNNSITKKSSINMFDLDSKKELVSLINPLSNELSVLRSNMLFTGLETLRYNLNRQIYNLKFFEFGKTYSLINKQYIEEDRLAIFASGVFKGDNWNEESRNVDFFLMKGVLDKLIDRFFPASFKFSLRELKNNYTDLGIAYSHELISKSENLHIIEMGSFSQAILNVMGIKKPIYYIDVNLELFINLFAKQDLKYQDIPKFPSVKRDLSLLLNQDVPYVELEQSVRVVSNDFLKDIVLFDVYQGDKIQKNKKSYAISFVFRDDNQTLTDNQVDKEILKIYNHLVSEFNVSLRDGEL